jgi:DNA polymerase-1
MKFVDVISLLPPEADPGQWAKVLSYKYGSTDDVAYITGIDERTEWLRRLMTDEASWSGSEVITSHHGMLYWRLVHPRILVTTESGKKLPKNMRTDDPLAWAQAMVIRDHRKAALNKITDAEAHVAQRVMGELLRSRVAEDSLLHTDGQYELLRPEQWQDVMRQIQKHCSQGGWVSWDSETTQTGEDDTKAPNPWDAALVGVSLSIRPGHAWYLPIAHVDADDNLLDNQWSIEETLAFIYGMNFHIDRFKARGARALLWNAKYDYSVLCNPIHNLDPDIVYGWLDHTEDGMLLANQTLDLAVGLKAQAPRRLGVTIMDYKALTKGEPFSKVPLEYATVYAGQDADWPLRLWPLLHQEVQDLGTHHVYQREVNIIEYFMRTERRGIRIDQAELNKRQLQAQERADTAKQWFIKLLARKNIKLPTNFNIGSGPQIATVLYASAPKGLGLPVVRRTATGQPSTDKKTLNKLRSMGIEVPILSSLIAWRENTKLITGNFMVFRKHIKEDGRVHTSFNSVGARTGRTSADNPPVQIADYETRYACVPEPGGSMASIDYSQIELRVLACEFNEPLMIEVYNRPRFNPDGTRNLDADIHEQTRISVGLPTRRLAKNFNFGVAFGGQAPTIAETGNIPLNQAERFMGEYETTYADFIANRKARQKRDIERGYTEDWLGRKRPVQKPTNLREKGEAERLVANTPVQMGALDIIKWAMEELLPLLRQAEQVGIHPFNMVHDELDFERDANCDDATWHTFLAKARDIMEACNPFKSQLPIHTDVEMGPSWGGLREIEPDYLDAAIESETVELGVA